MLCNKELISHPPVFIRQLGFKEYPFFFCGYSLWLVVAVLNTSSFVDVFGHNNFLYYVSVLLFLFQEFIFIKYITLIDVLFAACLCFFNIQTYLIGHEDLLAFSILLYCGRRVSFKCIAKCTILIQSVVSFIVISSSLIGFIPSTVNVRDNGVIRYSLGFSYVTYPSYVFLNIVLLWLYIRKASVTYIELSVFTFLNSALLIITNARNACGLIFFALFWAVILKLYSKYTFPLLVKRLFVYSFSFFAFAYTVIVVLYLYFRENIVLQIINKFFSSRLDYSSFAIKHFGVPIIGGYSKNLVDNGLTLDSSYFRLVYDHGLIFMLTVIILYTLLMKKATEDNDNWLILALFIIASHSVFDAQLISFQHNTFLFLLATVIPGSNNELLNSHLLTAYRRPKHMSPTSDDLLGL
ncbi:hypothetical protein [Bifidobacterium jacchi]|uniref:Polymerase n=1 Tax=Bifidobacterium jacchi TaxID=2490545 RepID=A0A5N5RCF9_9BIFI|nr:hypothetical protein [Bifidobacterium jacchi]KAB5604162.1 hypothetical protein EHS19_10025 [Bifidobacterium jacchi]